MFQLRQDFIQLREDFFAVKSENERLAAENAMLRSQILTPHSFNVSSMSSPFHHADTQSIQGPQGQEEEVARATPPAWAHASSDLIVNMYSGPHLDLDKSDGVCISDGSLGQSVSENILEGLKKSQTELALAHREVARLKAELDKAKERAEEEEELKEEDGSPPQDLRRSGSFKSVQSSKGSSGRSSPRNSRLAGPLDRVSHLGRILKAYVKAQEV